MGEVVWRVRKLLWQITARVFRKIWEVKYRSSSANFRAIPEKLNALKFYGLGDTRPNNVPRKWIDNTIAAAEKILLCHYDCLALTDINLGKEINWNFEYKRGIRTPLKFGPWMDYHDTKSYGDFKYFWELPRLQHLITLAKAYYLTGQEKYAEEVTNQIKSFDEQSPYLLGVNWIMPMEASIRLVSISWITILLKGYLKKNVHACELIGRLVQSHIDYVTRNYAAYSSANNHLVAEAAGVFIASICFGGFERISAHNSTAYRILCEEIVRQNYEDGVNKEQAVHYHIFAFNFLLMAGLLGRANNAEFPDQYWKMLEKNAAFIAAIADDNCLLPEIGDSDDGRAVALSETDENFVRSILATSAVLFNREEFKAKAGYFDETSLWLLGSDGQRKFDDIKAQSATTRLPAKFEHGGYYILAGGGSANPKIVFDCGPLGFGAIAAHGHADSLSFTLDAYERAFFIDPGTYTYVATDPFRNYFRGTAAHNTVVIDSGNQSEIAGPFLWKAKANSFVLEWQDKDDFSKVVAGHDGYTRLADPVIHKRSIELHKKEELVIITDWIESDSSHSIVQYYHLSPDCVVNKSGANVCRITNKGRSVELVADERASMMVVRAGENPLCGWAGLKYDRKVPIETIVCRIVSGGKEKLTTRIKLVI